MNALHMAMGKTGLAVLLLTLLVAGCKKQDERNGIVGKVSLGGVPGPGIRVELYDYPIVGNLTGWTVATAHPSVGVAYSLSAGFDWRRESNHLQASVITGSDGSFNFPNLVNGQYVIVAHTESFGWSAPMQADLAGSKLDVGTIPLLHEINIPANTTIQADTTWSSGQHYVLAGTMSIAAGVTLTIEPGVVVRLSDPNDRINVRGTLHCEGTPSSYILFTSNAVVPQASDWYCINYAPGSSPPLLRYCAFTYGETGILSLTAGATVENCYFAFMNTTAADLRGVDDSGGSDSVTVRRNVIDHTPVGLRVAPAQWSGTAIEHNVIVDAQNWGLDLQHVYGGSVDCNWFINCGREDTLPGHETGVISILYASNVVISHNEFQQSWWAIWLGSRVDSSVIIRENHFNYLNRVVSLGVGGEHYAPSYPTIHMNCCDHIDGYLIFYSICDYNYRDLNADSNYWGGLNGESLDFKILDCVDDRACGCVTTTIVLPSCPSGVGLCSE